MLLVKRHAPKAQVSAQKELAHIRKKETQRWHLPSVLASELVDRLDTEGAETELLACFVCFVWFGFYDGGI